MTSTDLSRALSRAATLTSPDTADRAARALLARRAALQTDPERRPSRTERNVATRSDRRAVARGLRALMSDPYAA